LRLILPSDNSDPVVHFLASVNDLFVHVLRDVNESGIEGIPIQNQKNQNDKPIGISFRWKDQIPGDAIWRVFEMVPQSNSRLNVLHTLFLTVHSFRVPIVLVYRGRSLSVMAQLKRSIVEVKAEENCLARSLRIAIAKVDIDSNYDAFRKGRKIRHVV